MVGAEVVGLARQVDARAIQHLELGLPERWRALVFAPLTAGRIDRLTEEGHKSNVWSRFAE